MLHDEPFSAFGNLQPDPRVSATAIAARAATIATVASAVAAAAGLAAAVATALTTTTLDATAFSPTTVAATTALDATTLSTTTVAATALTAATTAADTAASCAHRHIGQRKLSPHVGAVGTDPSQRALCRCCRAACAVLPSHVARPCQPPHLARPCQPGPADDVPPGKSICDDLNGRLGIPARLAAFQRVHSFCHRTNGRVASVRVVWARCS